MPLKSPSPPSKPAAGQTSTGKTRGDSRPAKPRSRGGASSRKRRPSGSHTGNQTGRMLLPFATVGLLAAALLAGLIYWGVSSPDGSRTASAPKPVQPIASAEKEPHAASPVLPPPRHASAPAVAAKPPGSSAAAVHAKASQETAPVPTTPPPPPPPPAAPAAPPPFKPVPAPVSAPPASVSPKEDAARAVDKKPAEVPVPTASPRENPVEEPVHLALAPHPKIPALNPPTEWKPSIAPPLPPRVQPPETLPVARVAIVIDDFGLSLEMARRFLDLPWPVTFSVLPYLKHSQEVIRLAHDRGREVLLHLPMEPQEYPKVNPGQGALLVSMSEEKILQATQAALDASPHIAGVNNHMGSRFTEKTGHMKVVLAELQRRGLFFLDSRTSEKSVGYKLAGELHLPTARRDIFLDHDIDFSAVQAQVERLIRKARIEGKAIAIGHPHESTLKALREAADRFAKERIAVVSAGELVREPSAKAGLTQNASPQAAP